jgi:hypothetical protein
VSPAGAAGDGVVERVAQQHLPRRRQSGETLEVVAKGVACEAGPHEVSRPLARELDDEVAGASTT